MDQENSVPAFAVTAAVGAVVLLIMLFFTMSRKTTENEGFFFNLTLNYFLFQISQ
jgi:hypothetical protein